MYIANAWSRPHT